LTNEENFKDLAIDDEFFQKILIEHEDGENNEVRGNTSTEPKLHTIPRGVVNLENLFDLREKFKHPKNVKTSSSCPPMKL
jgi:hypothetical protein